MEIFHIFGLNYIVMEELNYVIVSPEMVWQWYYDSNRSKHFKELLGKEAQTFIQLLESGRELYIEDLFPRTSGTTQK
jgi:hypothetical protein